MTDGRANLATRAAIASITMALGLLVLKTYAAVATGSVAMLGSLADTALDVIASFVTLYGVRMAAMPADADHRFGHGKAEALAALFQVVLIGVSACAILWRAVERMVHGEVTARAEFGIGVSVIAIVATIGLLAYQRHVIARTGSVAINADHVHYQSDVLLNLAVIAAIAIDQYGGIGWADPVFGVGIAIVLIIGAWRAAGQAIDQLMDREWPEDKRRAFLDFAATLPPLAGLHDLRTRTSGTHDFVQFHVWVDPDMTVAEAHEIIDAAEDALIARFPGTEILIHLDPEGQVDKEGILPTELAEHAPL